MGPVCPGILNPWRDPARRFGVCPMKVTIEKNELVIRVPLQEPTPSSTGKTLVVASSHGNQKTDALVDGKPVIVGLNAYIKP